MKAFWIILSIVVVSILVYYVVKKKKSDSSGSDKPIDAKDYGDMIARSAECTSDRDCGPGARCVGGGCENSNISSDLIVTNSRGFQQIPYSQVGKYFQSPHFTQPVVSDLENYMSGKAGK